MLSIRLRKFPLLPSGLLRVIISVCKFCLLHLWDYYVFLSYSVNFINHINLEYSMKLFWVKICLLLVDHHFFFFIYIQRGRVGEREEEKHQCVFASHVAPTGDLACNPGLSPDWEKNQ